MVVDQATMTVLALRVPAMARLRPLFPLGGGFAVMGGLVAMAWGAMHDPGTERWILLSGGMALVAQGVLTFLVVREATSSQPRALARDETSTTPIIPKV